jgi:uncharacterized protein YyaL (SSP411 family)
MYANELKYEQSPYLLQHKNNPVNWLAWNNDTLNKALKENKPIFLSIGYSTCHWCHVMEEESFENKEVAKVLNDSYISIKIDREEMPQIDSFYQHIYQVMNGRSGGWPLTIIMTPEKKVFYSATYMLKENLIKTLNTLSDIYSHDKTKIKQITSQLQSFLDNNNNAKAKKVHLKLKTSIDTFITAITNSYDEKFGGFNDAPKFPMATTLSTMLDIYKLTNNQNLLNMVTKTLKFMAKGGIYDQIEGGFYRYSVDDHWEIPHFEKMLYTQGELLEVYAKAYQITKNIFYKKIAQEIVGLVDKRFKKSNLLFSASDADSLDFDGKKEEGFYFLYDYQQTHKFLKQKGYDTKNIYDILKYFNITSEQDLEYTIGNPYITNEEPISNLVKIKNDLRELRDSKKYPFIDKKIQTSWNAMYISSLLKASKIDNNYGKKAIQLLDSLIKNLYLNQTLYHQKILSKPLKIKALFEDYSFLIDANIQAYQYNFDKKYLDFAYILTKEAISKFYKKDIWYLSDDEFNSKSNIFDSAYKSSQSLMIENLFKLSLLKDNRGFYKLAKQSLEQNSYYIKNAPNAIATAFNVYVGNEKQYRVLKSTKENLLKNKTFIDKVNYPYLVLKSVEDEQYLACTINSCFSFDKNISKVLKDIEDF